VDTRAALLADSFGEDCTRQTIRLALLFYFLAVVVMLFLRHNDWQARSWRGRLARCAWTLGWFTYLVHVAAAFHYHYHWSHTEAMTKTDESSGLPGGIFFSHLFTLLWTGDVAWWWLSPQTYATRSRRIGAFLHCYMIFIIVNATVVFPTGTIRWAGAVGLLLLGALVLVRSVSLKKTKAEERETGGGGALTS